MTSTNPASQAFQWLVGKGYTPAQAAGIVGNLQHESGFNTRATHDQGTGFGIAGWRDPTPGQGRWTGLKNFAAQNRSDPASLETQLGYLDWELKNKEHRARDALAKAQTPQQAAAAFLHFERPQGYDPNNPLASHGAANRVGLAQKAFATEGAGLPAGTQNAPAGNVGQMAAGVPPQQQQPPSAMARMMPGLLTGYQAMFGTPQQAPQPEPIGLLPMQRQQPTPFDAQRYAGLLSGGFT
jgi:hypothetical protein